jgi:signal transduction histidine kinase
MLVAAILIATIVVVSSLAYFKLRDSLLSGLDEALLLTADGMMAETDEPPDQESLDAVIRETFPTGAVLRAPRYRVWLDGSAKDLAAAGIQDDAGREWVRALRQTNGPGPDSTSFFRLGLSDRTVWIRRRTTLGETNVAVSASSRGVARELREFLRMLLLLGGGMVLGGASLGLLAVFWAIRPIGRTAERLREITHRDLGREPLDDLQPPAELRPFVDAVAGLLARLNEILQRQRQFTADASHELRTPLALAKSTLQAVRTREREAPDYRQAIDETLGDLGRAERLLAQLLVLARMDESDDPPGDADVPLDALLARLARDLEPAASARGSRIEVEPMAPASVRGSEEQLLRLFGNLVENALVHGPREGTVRLGLSTDPEGQCTIRIHDEGGSIPPEALPHLFERFYRIDGSRSRATGGAGLGMAIAREIAKRHGGDVRIASAPSSGTVVTVRLPRLFILA